MNEIVLGKDVLPSLIEAGRVTCHTPFLHPDRILPFNVLLYVISGKITVIEEDVQYTVLSGELIFLKTKKHHWGSELVETGTEWGYIHFTLPEENLQSSNSLILPKKVSGLLYSEVEENLLKLIKNTSTQNSKDVYKLKATLYLLLVDIKFFKVSITTAKEQLTERLAAYLEKIIALPFDSQKLAEEFNLSSKYLESVFKEQKHISLQKYHTSLKVREACRILRTTTYSIGEISQQLGYQNAFYFSHVFSKVTGTSPSDYRKQLKNYSNLEQISQI